MRALSEAQMTRVQVQMQLTSQISATSTLDEQRALQESLRRELYEMAAKECDLISGVFKDDCRLQSLNLNSNSFERGNQGTQAVTASANATFELTPKAAK